MLTVVNFIKWGFNELVHILKPEKPKRVELTP